MMEFEIIYNDGNGRMTLNIDNFFPCSQSNLKKLCKIIDTCADPYTKIHELHHLLGERKKALETMCQDIKKDFQDAYTLKCDLEHMVKDGRYPSGLPLKRDELKEKKKELKEQSKCVNGMVSDFKRFTRDSKKVGSNMTTLKSLYEGWFDE